MMVATIVPLAPTKDDALLQQSWIHRASCSDSTVFNVQPWLYRIVWVVTIFVHLLVGLVFAIVAFLYMFAVAQYENVSLTLRATTVVLNKPVAVCVVGITTLIAVLHLRSALGAIYRSIQQLSLIFYVSTSSESRTSTSKSSWYQRCRVRWKQVVALFSVHGPYFDTMFQVRECLELLLQTYQTYQITWSMALGWVRFCVVAMLVINCWRAPFCHWIVKRGSNSMPLVRLVSLTCDAILDFWIAVDVPCLILVPYFNELQLVMITTWLSLLSQLFPGLGLVHCLKNVKLLVVPARSQHTFTQKPSADKPVGHAPASRGFTTRAFHVLLCLYGIGIIVVDVMALRHAAADSNPHCVVAFAPWLAVGGHPCAVTEINCYHHQLNGSEHEMDQALDGLNPDTLASITFSHCTALEIPPKVTYFFTLAHFEVFNSSITAWNEEAALRQTYHPQLCVIVLVSTRLPNDSLPRGLLSDDFLSSIGRFSIVDVPLTSLPPNLPAIWKFPIAVMEIGRSDLSRVDLEPLTALQIPLGLTLAHVNLTFVPVTLIHGRELAGSLDLSHNPHLASLSNDPRITPRFMQTLYLEGTNISELPEWVHTQVGAKAFLYDTPLCRNRSLISSTKIQCTKATMTFEFPFENYRQNKAVVV